MAAKVWSGVAIAVQSALATAVTISGITKANPAVVSWASGTDPANGDFVLLEIQGMSQLDYRVVRVANLNGAGNTFECEGVDSTLFDTFTSGTFKVITFGTTLSTIADLSVSGGDFNFIDVTTIQDNVNKQIPGNANPINISMTANWDPLDAGVTALKTASDSKAIRAVRITFADATKVLFAGYVGATNFPTGSAQNKVSTPISFNVYGRTTAYST
jgi:hypothetical protein